jgi:D-glycero-D-manno-heptose 1,7-bisphosphate phosphatase
MTPAVFLDRDGTIIEEAGYLDRLDRIALYPWSGAALRALQQAGYVLVVVTNQGGVARGYINEPFVREAHRELDAMLRAEGVAVAGYYYCPHDPAGTIQGYCHVCECRKPASGLVRTAASELGLDVARSFVVGDKWIDVELAQNVGARGVLVRTGYGRSIEGTPPAGVRAAAVVDTLLEASEWILGQCRAGAGRPGLHPTAHTPRGGDPGQGGA